MISVQCFSHLLLWLYISSFRNGEWTTDAALYPSFPVTCLQRFVFSEMWIHLRLCFGSTSYHSKATYGSCRQPASHKSCKVPENMIYELSYGKWGPLIFLTLQDAVTCHRMFFLESMEGVSECFHPQLPLPPPPANTDFSPFTSTHKERSASLSH